MGNEIGRLPPQFGDASRIANTILKTDFEFDIGKLLYNQFRSVVSYRTSEIDIFPLKSVNAAEKLTVYDSVDADVLQVKSWASFLKLLYEFPTKCDPLSFTSDSRTLSTH